MPTEGSEYSDEQIRERLQYSEIAGGEKYVSDLPEDDIPTKDDADYVVEAGDGAEEFFTATNNANDVEGGGVVYVEGDAEIDFSGASGLISDCTVVSDKGRNGSDGALLYTTDHGHGTNVWDAGPGVGLFTLHQNVRFFGLRVRGPTHDYWDNPSYPGYIPFRFGELDAGERDEFRSEWSSRGINVQGENVTIENCKLWGFSTHGISVGGHDEDQDYEPVISHCDIHDNMQSGLGYNVNIYRGNPDIDYCYFNASRHTFATFGYWNSGYHVTNSVIGPATSFFLCDTHNLGENSASESTNMDVKGFIGRASGNVRIENITFTPTNVIEEADYAAGDPTSHVSLGGIPWPPDDTGAVIKNNRCAHESLDDAFYQSTSGDGWSASVGEHGFSENVVVEGNQYGAPDAPKKDGIGAPIDLTAEGAPDQPDQPEQPEEPEDSPDKTGLLAVFAEDSETEERISGATVTIEKVNGDIKETKETADIDIADGGANFGQMPVGYYHISVTQDGYENGSYDQELWRDEGEQSREAMHLDTVQRLPIIYLTPKPEKPETPEKPGKPEKPDKPGKPEKPGKPAHPPLESVVRGIIRDEVRKMNEEN